MSATPHPAVTHLEVERTYEVPADVPVPPLTGLPGVAQVAAPVLHELVATYFDTAVLTLARRRITVRRRTGGEDAGWHLKLPAGVDARTELRRPLGRAVHTVPAAVVAPVRVHVRSRRLAPVAVAVVTNHRQVHRLLDGAGAVLAELCDDHVTAEALGDQPGMNRWREWEVELVTGSVELLEAVQAQLLTSGAVISASPSKLGRALGFRLPPPEPSPEALPDRTDAGTAALGAVRQQVATLVRSDPLVRADAPDSVHQLRVATRTLRSLLATYRPVLDRATTDPLRAELRWVAGVLGHARDAEVLRARCAELLVTQPAGLVLGPVQRRLDRELAKAYRDGHRDVVRTLDGARWFALLDGLDALLVDPPLTDRAHEPAADVLPHCVRKDLTHLRAAVDADDAAPTPQDRTELLHEVRKRAKRLRYACESVEPVCGKPARKLGRAAKQVQTVLGEHQDAAVTRQLLRDTAARAHAAGEPTFTYGRLDAMEEQRGTGTEEHFAQAWATLSDKNRRRWLRP